MMRVYGMAASGNCYKVRLLLELLNLPYEWVEVDLLQGATRTPTFLRRNPNGKVPVLELSDGRCLAESNAILCFLADGTRFWPTDVFLRAQTMQWLFFEQYSHEPYIAVARFIRKFLPPGNPREAELPHLHGRGMQALAVMEQHLAKQPFLVGSGFGIADISLYAYTHSADDGGFDLSVFPHVRDWLSRVEHQPGFVPQNY